MRSADLEREWTARMVQVAEMLVMLDNGRGARSLEGGEVTSVRILLPGPDRSDVLVIVKASKEGASWVGFVGGLDLATAMRTWRKKELAEGLRFREDVPWQGPADSV